MYLWLLNLSVERSSSTPFHLFLRSWTECIEWLIKNQAWFGSSPTPFLLPSPLPREQVVSLSPASCVLPVKLRTGWGDGAKSYDGEKAWSSINHSVLSDHKGQQRDFLFPFSSCIISVRWLRLQTSSKDQTVLFWRTTPQKVSLWMNGKLATTKSSVVDLDPDSMRSLFSDPDSRSGSRRGKMTHKNRKKVLFWRLKAFPVAWTSFKEV